MPGMGPLSVDEKTAILIKSYELEALPKLALETGEKATRELLHSGQYLGHLVRRRHLGFIGLDENVQLIDPTTAQRVRDDPVYGFSQYVVDHGTANVYGKQIFEGKVPLEPSIGAASAIGIVERDKDGTIKVYRKKQLGIKTEPLREVAKKFHRTEQLAASYGGAGEVTSNLDYIRRKTEQQQKTKEEMEEEVEEKEIAAEVPLTEKDLDLNFLKSDEDDTKDLELKEEEKPELLEPEQEGIPKWSPEKPDNEMKAAIRYILPIETDEEKEEEEEEPQASEDDDLRLPWS